MKGCGGNYERTLVSFPHYEDVARVSTDEHGHDKVHVLVCCVHLTVSHEMETNLLMITSSHTAQHVDSPTVSISGARLGLTKMEV